MIILFQHLSPEQSRAYSLVLSSMNIHHLTVENEEGWDILVHEKDYERARYHIEQYLQENNAAASPHPSGSETYPKSVSGLWAAFLLMLWHLQLTSNQSLEFLVRRYGASATRILNGELYRTVTALGVHADAVHLMANMAGLALFGTAVSALTGWGVGWFMILLSGIIGNYLTAVFYQAMHIAVGASTSVFGALGILCGHQFVLKINIPGERIRALLPLGGGFALLSFLGSGERSDVVAHLLGFLVGIGFGLAYTLLVKEPPGKMYQIGYFVALVILLAVSWTQPFVYA
jgi:membrane associated rhomboid family serine protease